MGWLAVLISSTNSKELGRRVPWIYLPQKLSGPDFWSEINQEATNWNIAIATLRDWRIVSTNEVIYDKIREHLMKIFSSEHSHNLILFVNDVADFPEIIRGRYPECIEKFQKI